MNTSELKSKLEKSLEFFKNELTQIRTGRATPTLIEGIEVDAYGTLMKLRELGSITTMDSQNLAVIPWDKSLMQSIVKAIRDSELKLNPVIDNDRVRVPVPALTEDRRKEFVKLASSKCEESKNVMRGIRQDAMRDIEKSFTDKEIGEDEKFTQKDAVEKIVKEYVTKTDELLEAKKADLLKV